MKTFLCNATACASLLAGVATLCGCASSMNTTERAQPVGQAEMVDEKRVLTDRGLDVRARIMGVNQSTTAGGMLKVQVELLNTTRSTRNLHYRFEWFDQNGMEVKTPATVARIPLTLEGKESKFISGVAPTPACKDFRLKLTKN